MIYVVSNFYPRWSANDDQVFLFIIFSMNDGVLQLNFNPYRQNTSRS